MGKTGKKQYLEEMLKKKAKDEKVFLNAEQLRYVHKKTCEGSELAMKVFQKFLETQINVAKKHFEFNVRQRNYYRNQVYRQAKYTIIKYKPGNITKSLYNTIIWVQAPNTTYKHKDSGRVERSLTEAPVSDDDETRSSEVSLEDLITDDHEAQIKSAVLKKKIHEIVDELDHNEKYVIKGYFWEDKSFKILAEELCYNSPNSARNIFLHAIEYLRSRFIELGLNKEIGKLEPDKWNAWTKILMQKI